MQKYKNEIIYRKMQNHKTTNKETKPKCKTENAQIGADILVFKFSYRIGVQFPDNSNSQLKLFSSSHFKSDEKEQSIVILVKVVSLSLCIYQLLQAHFIKRGSFVFEMELFNCSRNCSRNKKRTFSFTPGKDKLQSWRQKVKSTQP